MWEHSCNRFGALLSSHLIDIYNPLLSILTTSQASCLRNASVQLVTKRGERITLKIRWETTSRNGWRWILDMMKWILTWTWILISHEDAARQEECQGMQYLKHHGTANISLSRRISCILLHFSNYKADNLCGKSVGIQEEPRFCWILHAASNCASVHIQVYMKWYGNAACIAVMILRVEWVDDSF